MLWELLHIVVTALVSYKLVRIVNTELLVSWQLVCIVTNAEYFVLQLVRMVANLL